MPRNAKDGPNINQDIRAPKLRVVGADGEMLGILGREDALRVAVEAGLDLVEVSPNADPPVCKILDYGKFRYEQQKKKKEARSKQKEIVIKEVKIRPNIDENDYQVKLRNMVRFIEEGDKVKVTLRFRGREMAHNELGMDVMKRIKADLGESIKVELEPALTGRQMIMVVVPANVK